MRSGSSRGCAGRGRARGATAHSATAVLVLNTTLGVIEGSGGNALGLGCVDTESQPGEDAVRNAVADERVLVEGVDSVSEGLLLQDGVLGVGGELLLVGAVGGHSLNGGDQGLVEEALTYVAGGDRVAQGSVGKDGGVGVDHQVDVGGAGGVMAGEDGLELHNTVAVAQLDTAEPGVVDVGLIRRVTVTGSNNTGVDTGGVAVPHLQVDVGDGVAGVDVNDLVVNDGIDTTLFLDDVASDVLATNVYKTS